MKSKKEKGEGRLRVDCVKKILLRYVYMAHLYYRTALVGLRSDGSSTKCRIEDGVEISLSIGKCSISLYQRPQTQITATSEPLHGCFLPLFCYSAVRHTAPCKQEGQSRKQKTT